MLFRSPGAGQRVFDLPQFSQRWVDAGNEPFACFNLNTPAGQFVTGTSPTDFRSASRGFVLNGNLYALGQATGGAVAVTGGFNAVAPRRALANADLAGNRGAPRRSQPDMPWVWRSMPSGHRRRQDDQIPPGFLHFDMRRYQHLRRSKSRAARIPDNPDWVCPNCPGGPPGDADCVGVSNLGCPA